MGIFKIFSKKFTIWILGSYSSMNSTEKELTEILIKKLSYELVKMKANIVMGESEMLIDFAESFKKAARDQNIKIKDPVIISGKLRNLDLRKLFNRNIGCVPNVGLFMGGGIEKGRSLQEYNTAKQYQIPIIAVHATGGTAKQVESTVKLPPSLFEILNKTVENIDVDSLVKAIINAIKH